MKSILGLLVGCTAFIGMIATPVQIVSPVAIEVSDIPFPTVGPAFVAVTLLAGIRPDGHVSQTEIIDIAGSTPGGARYTQTLAGYEYNALTALKNWRFSLPSGGSVEKATPVLGSVSFLYRRRLGFETLPRLRTATIAPGDYVPPILESVTDPPEYPWNSIGSGAVILTLNVDAAGSVEDAKTIRSVASLDEPSLKAVKRWRFVPAKSMGKPVPSVATVAIVYFSDPTN